MNRKLQSKKMNRKNHKIYKKHRKKNFHKFTLMKHRIILKLRIIRFNQMNNTMNKNNPKNMNNQNMNNK